MPIALPRSLTSQTSAIVPAPTACTLAAAPPPSTRMMISMAMSFDTAERMLNSKNSVNDVRYMVRRPRVSENEDHQSGNIDMESIYKAAERFVIVGEVCRSSEI